MNAAQSMDQLAAFFPVFCAFILGFAVVMYVILDGFDLGLGILFPTTRDEHERDLMMNSVAPFWDGNETWLVLGGSGLLVFFPKAYAVIMPAIYLPVIAMLLALIFRGVSFEYRWVSKPNHLVWDVAFAGGSIVASFSQGVILGAYLQGITELDGRFAGGALDWLTPFSLLCGLGVVAGYALLGATWLIMKTDGRLAAHARRWAGHAFYGVAAAAAIVSLWTPLAFPAIGARWFSFPNILFLWPIPIVTGLVGFLVWRTIRSENDSLPFFGTIGLFLLCFLGLAISIFPNLVPPDITIWNSASAPEAQIFLLVGVLLMLPIILGYTIFNYYLFRGKLKVGEGYH